MRSLPGEDWEESPLAGERRIVWNEDNSVCEFEIEIAGVEEGDIIGFNIALSDNDKGEGRDAQLYPVNGFNDSYKGINLGELEFAAAE